MNKLKRYELPPKTGIFVYCKICKELKDECYFKYQHGKRAGFVCRECDRKQKQQLYKNDEKVRENYKNKANQYHHNNKEKVAIKSKEYRKINEKDLKRKKSIYHIENRNCINDKTRIWVKENKNRHKANCKKYQEINKEKLQKLKSKYYQKNKHLFKEKMKEWRNKNPHLITAYVRQYNLAKINRTPVWADVKIIQKFYKNCPDNYEVDHIHPLQGKLISGLHVIENLQYLTISENKSKGNKFKHYWVFYEPSGIRIEII